MTDKAPAGAEGQANTDYLNLKVKSQVKFLLIIL